jgi:hypothetical protein
MATFADIATRLAEADRLLAASSDAIRATVAADAQVYATAALAHMHAAQVQAALLVAQRLGDLHALLDAKL